MRRIRAWRLNKGCVMLISKFVRPLVVVSSVAALSACSSGGGGTVAVPSNSAYPGTIEGLRSALSVVQSGDVQIAPEMDRTGTAEMNGIVGVDLTLETVLLGDASVTANFDDQSLRGTATNFTEYEYAATYQSNGDVDPNSIVGTELENYDGTLDIVGDLNGTEVTGTMTGVVSGMIDDGQGGRTELVADVDTNLFGSVVERDGTLGVLAEVDGSADVTAGGQNDVLRLLGFLFVEE